MYMHLTLLYSCCTVRCVLVECKTHAWIFILYPIYLTTNSGWIMVNQHNTISNDFGFTFQIRTQFHSGKWILYLPQILSGRLLNTRHITTHQLLVCKWIWIIWVSTQHTAHEKRMKSPSISIMNKQCVKFSTQCLFGNGRVCRLLNAHSPAVIWLHYEH